MSKGHPGASEMYLKKKNTRESREKKRLLHKEAMDYYFAHFNNKGDNQKVLNRKTILQIK
jgi:hypothetical protein